MISSAEPHCEALFVVVLSPGVSQSEMSTDISPRNLAVAVLGKISAAPKLRLGNAGQHEAASTFALKNSTEQNRADSTRHGADDGAGSQVCD
jgi:hypothetical protein